ncbi:hypothetical protein [Nocardia sp. R6R-6]|uniref:hypothetical protein n=1 Tax=Nocardia sp. R6R-6 TaxID=3459303 RepID=UPI00403DBD2B
MVRLRRTAIALSVATAALLMAPLSACDADTARTAPTPSTTPWRQPTTTAAAPKPVFHPTPDQISLSLTTVKKSCFGSAGCNVNVHVDPTFLFQQEIPAGKKWTVIYEIRGGEDGPKINNFTFTRGDSADNVSYRIAQEESVSTSGPNDLLTVSVTDILASGAA